MVGWLQEEKVQFGTGFFLRSSPPSASPPNILQIFFADFEGNVGWNSFLLPSTPPLVSPSNAV